MLAAGTPTAGAGVAVLLSLDGAYGVQRLVHRRPSPECATQCQGELKAAIEFESDDAFSLSNY